MDLQRRALINHIDYDRMFYVSYYLEKEGTAVPLSGIISIIKNKLLTCHEVLRLWEATLKNYEKYLSDAGRVDPLDQESGYIIRSQMLSLGNILAKWFLYALILDLFTSAQADK